MSLKIKLTIQRKLLISYLSLVIFILALVNIVWTISARSILKEQIIHNQERLADEASSRLINFVNSKTQLLLSRAQSAAFLGADINTARLEMSIMLTQDGSLQEIVLINTKGQELLKAAPGKIFAPEELTNIKNSPKFVAAAYRYGQEYIGDIYFSAAGDPMLTVAVPIAMPTDTDDFARLIALIPALGGKERGEVVGVLAAEINLKDLFGSISDIKFGKEGYIYVVDGDNRVIAHPNKEFLSGPKDILQVDIIKKQLIRENEFFQKSGLRAVGMFTTSQGLSEIGQEVLATYVRVPTLFWGVVVEQSTKEAFADLRLIERIIFLLVPLSIFLTILVSLILASRLTRSVRELSLGAEVIGRGNLSYRFDIHSNDETEQLAEAFNKMTENLSRSLAELEEAKTILEIKVQARTKELQELIDNLEERVRERTWEIREKMQALERFNRLSIGRELKMIELKREIETLKRQIVNNK